MRKLLTAGLAALTLTSSLAAAGAADARPPGYYGDRYYGDRYYGGRDYRRHRNDDSDAIAAGIVGLALGAALASGSNGRRYDRGYYYEDRRYYAPPPAYYYGPPRYQRSCRTTTYWDPYYGDYVERRTCW